jgi:hypothetical protein
MSGGGKGGSQTTSVTIPAWLEQAAQRNIAKAEDISQTGFVPYMGPDVAALSPMQVAAMQGTGQAAAAFGLGGGDVMAGMPQAQQFAGGVQGYSAYPLYSQSLANLQATAPGQFAALQAPFINPVTGAIPGAPYMTGAQAAGMVPTAAAAPVQDERNFYGRGGGDY